MVTNNILERGQLFINAIFECHWTPIIANRFSVPNTEEFFEGIVALQQYCGLCCQENSDGELAELLEGMRISLGSMLPCFACQLGDSVVSIKNCVCHLAIGKTFSRCLTKPNVSRCPWICSNVTSFLGLPVLPGLAIVIRAESSSMFVISSSVFYHGHCTVLLGIPIVYQLLGSNIPYLGWLESLEKQQTPLLGHTYGGQLVPLLHTVKQQAPD